jgi:phosphoribosylglycinamide formyltransferase-1
MKSLVFLVSGSGGNLRFIYSALENNVISGIKLSVIADRDCGALEFAREKKIDNYLISYSRYNSFDLNFLLDKINPDLIITNWNKIIDKITVLNFFGKFINLHYSLLPAFSGLIGVEPIKRAYENGCKFIGPTCHLVDEGVDTGRIVSQAIFTTDRAFDEAVSLMFKKGCLVLLVGIEEVLGQNLVMDRSTILNHNYSPALGFDESLFNEKFWIEIKNQ